MKFKSFPSQISNIWFVSKQYGDDITGDGSREAPFKSPSAPALSGAVAGDRVIIDTGLYNDILPTSVALNYCGEGLVVFSDPTQVSDSFFGSGSFESINNIHFVNTPFAAITASANTVIRNCSFHYCNYKQSDVAITAYECLFNNTVFESGGTPKSSFINCVFSGCSGTIVRLSNVGVKLVNNYFFANNTISNAVSIPVSKPTGVEFDYNCFENGSMTLFGYTLSQYQAGTPVSWANNNSIQESNPFIDFDTSRGVSDIWKNAYNLTSASFCATSGAGQFYESFIGAKGVAFPLSGATIFAAISVSSNVQLTGGLIERIDDLIEGSFETGVMAINGGQVEIINLIFLNQLINYNLDGSLFSASDYEAEPVKDDLVNQKTVLDIQIAIGETALEASTATFKSYEQNYDFAIDSAGEGSASPSFDIGAQTPIQALSHVRVRGKIKNF